MEKNCQRSNRAQNNQTTKARATSTPVGVAGNPELGQIRHHLPQMKRLLEMVEEKDLFMGPEMERIADLSIQENMSTLSSLTTLTIDI